MLEFRAGQVALVDFTAAAVVLVVHACHGCDGKEGGSLPPFLLVIKYVGPRVAQRVVAPNRRVSGVT
jgi:hypothetical protein